MLGTIYLSGQGVAIDNREAEHWWRMAAEQGHAAAQYNLGGMYSRQLSTTLSLEEALDWLGRAAEQGHRSAARELAALHGMAAAPDASESGPSDAAGGAEVDGRAGGRSSRPARCPASRRRARRSESVAAQLAARGCPTPRRSSRFARSR